MERVKEKPKNIIVAIIKFRCLVLYLRIRLFLIIIILLGHSLSHYVIPQYLAEPIDLCSAMAGSPMILRATPSDNMHTRQARKFVWVNLRVVSIGRNRTYSNRLCFFIIAHYLEFIKGRSILY